MWGTAAVTAFAAFCLSKWAWEADYINFASQTTGNGYFQCLFGRGVLGLAPPACYRILFPFLVAPDRREAPYAVPDSEPSRWIFYQVLRFLVTWLALLFLTSALGIVGTLIAAAIFGLSIHFDYWSNSVEFLAVAIVLASPHLCWPWWGYLAAGLVLGTGRETLPFLALLGSAPAVCLGLGAAISHGIVYLFADTEPHWHGTLEYRNPMWRANWDSLTGRNGPDVVWRVFIWLGIAIAASVSAPVLAVSLAVTTFLLARIDEPRVLTMLIPFVAMLWR